MTRAQAERELQRTIERELATAVVQRINVEEAGELPIDHLDSLGRKRSTIDEYRSYLRVHLSRFFGDAALGQMTRGRVEAFVAAKRCEGKATKSILNYLGLLHSTSRSVSGGGLPTVTP